MIAEARTDRDALAAGKAAAEHRAAELEGQLTAAMSDLDSAKVSGAGWLAGGRLLVGIAALAWILALASSAIWVQPAVSLSQQCS